MKKGFAMLLAATLLLTGCGNSSASTATPEPAGIEKETVGETQTEAVSAEAASAEQTENGTAAAVNDADTESESSSDALVIYFSRTGEQYTVGVIDKGNTAIVAEMIAEETGADLFEVLPEDDHYPMTYDALTDVAKQEQNDNARPVYAEKSRIFRSTIRFLSVLRSGGATGR